MKTITYLCGKAPCQNYRFIISHFEQTTAKEDSAEEMVDYQISLEEVHELIKLPCRVRSTVRITDLWPKDIADCTVLVNERGEIMSAETTISPGSKYVYTFAWLAQSSETVLPILVLPENANVFVGEMGASNLPNDSVACAQLTSKLNSFIGQTWVMDYELFEYDGQLCATYLRHCLQE
jgi:hypothetical protein